LAANGVGPITAGIAALGAVITAVPWREDFDGIVGGLQSLAGGLQWLWDRIKGLVASGAGIGGIFSGPASPGTLGTSPSMPPSGWRNQSFEGTGAQPSLARSVNWQPPERTPQPIHTAISLNVDGRQLAEAVSAKLSELIEFPTSAPYWDGKRGWSPPDMQTVTT
jgi:hypothetical protein